MAKGMNMEEFRNALSSEAREENEKLKKEIQDLKNKKEKEIKELEEELDIYKSWHEKLCNRCFVFTNGTICLNCNIDICKYAYTEEELEYVANYMNKNKMPRNEETLEKITKKLMNMRYGRLKSQNDKVDGK